MTGHHDGTLCFWELQSNGDYAKPLRTAKPAVAAASAQKSAEPSTKSSTTDVTLSSRSVTDQQDTDMKSPPSSSTPSGEPILDASIISSSALLSHSHSSSAPTSHKGVKPAGISKVGAGASSATAGMGMMGKYGSSMEILTPIPKKTSGGDMSTLSAESSILLRSSSTPSQRDQPEISYQELLRRASRCESPKSMLIGEESSAVLTVRVFSNPLQRGVLLAFISCGAFTTHNIGNDNNDTVVIIIPPLNT